jgi:hypothetical protein
MQAVASCSPSLAVRLCIITRTVMPGTVTAVAPTVETAEGVVMVVVAGTSDEHLEVRD